MRLSKTKGGTAYIHFFVRSRDLLAPESVLESSLISPITHSCAIRMHEKRLISSQHAKSWRVMHSVDYFSTKDSSKSHACDPESLTYTKLVQATTSRPFYYTLIVVSGKDRHKI